MLTTQRLRLHAESQWNADDLLLSETLFHAQPPPGGIGLQSFALLK